MALPACSVYCASLCEANPPRNPGGSYRGREGDGSKRTKHLQGQLFQWKFRNIKACVCIKFPSLRKHEGFILVLRKDPVKACHGEMGEVGTAGGKEERSVVGPPAPTGIVQKLSSKHISGNMSRWHDAKRQFIKGKFSDFWSSQNNSPRGYKQAAGMGSQCLLWSGAKEK